MENSKTPFVMVIFGATGDLTHAKLIPAPFSLFKQGVLPKEFTIIGFARRPLSDSEFADSFSDLIGEKEWESFTKHLSYLQGKFGEREKYKAIGKSLDALDRKAGMCMTRFFYLATPPVNYQEIIESLSFSKLAAGCGHSDHFTRIIVEKPFGKDLETAKALDQRLSEIF
jgi:glucose-6-phosphate 1-dehydrogenase